jgi:D-arabinose 1-dehydrogenase-like Zn-dependent alcohol dehydrogenase
MGSRQDLINATNFIVQHNIVPVVSHILHGLQAAEEGFQLLRRPERFGKIVIKIDDTIPAKL